VEALSSRSAAALAWREERDRLVGIAYRMLGDFGHAEDVVSEVALAAVRAERGAPVRSWPAWLTTTCVRRSIDRLRQLAAEREEYPGPWLPEPVAVDRLPEDVVADREMLSLTVLHLAEQLSPEARAAVVLHRAFGMSAVEIGRVLERSPAAVRQLISRGERRLQLDGDRAASPPPPSREALARVVEAIEGGDIAAVVASLADDAILWADGGGRVRSALNPVFGPRRIARFLAGILGKAIAAGVRPRVAHTEVNGEPGLSLAIGAEIDVIAFEFDASGAIRGIRRVSNPEKLTRVLA